MTSQEVLSYEIRHLSHPGQGYLRPNFHGQRGIRLKREFMKKKHVLFIVFVVILCVSVPALSLAHSGRTDSNGGHRDNKNVSGLGSYHYHCGGNPPHLHENGICPYRSSSSSGASGTGFGSTAARPSDNSSSETSSSSSGASSGTTSAAASSSSGSSSGYDAGYNAAKTELTQQFQKAKDQAFNNGVAAGKSEAQTEISNLTKKNDSLKNENASLKEQVETLKSESNVGGIAAGGVVGLAAGGIGSYFLTRRRYKK